MNVLFTIEYRINFINETHTMKDMCSVYPGAVNVSIVLIVTRIVLIILALDNSF